MDKHHGDETENYILHPVIVMFAVHEASLACLCTEKSNVKRDDSGYINHGFILFV